MSEPVTLGDLRVPCIHGRFEKCGRHVGVSINSNLESLQTGPVSCLGGRPATVADLMSPEIWPLVVSALRAEGMLVIEKVGGEWPDWAIAGNRYYWSISSVLDALAEAQPFPPAGR